jgi:hypothetical protein
VLVKGKGIPICEAHFKNLKSLSLNEMVCRSDEFYPEGNGITRPEWEEIDLKKNKELVKRIEKYFDFGDQNAKREMYDNEKEFDRYLDIILKIGDEIYLSNIDIDNDGKKEKILFYYSGRCMYTHVYSRTLLVWDEHDNLINENTTKSICHDTIGVYQIYDVLLYKNRTYFDRWNVRDWTLHVYIHSEGKTKEVCKYKYKR